MGLLIDTSVFIAWERSNRAYDFSRWHSFGEVQLSVISASELLVGVRRANNPQRQATREAFVEAILAKVPVVEINLGVARVHATLHAELMRQGLTLGAHDLWIAATALHRNDALLTLNTSEFSLVPQLQVVDAH